jgi:hypothetical protein
MGLPMFPRPMKPTLSMGQILLLPDSCCQPLLVPDR